MARAQLTRPLMWDGVAYAKGDTLTSLTTDEVIGLVSRGHALDLDGVAAVRNAVPAQLATDAGIPVGLSGGVPASGVPFGAPSTIFRLRMRCSGGAATVSVVATKRSGGTETFTYSLASGDDISEPMYAADYRSMVWGKVGTGTIVMEVI
jgi:hypothetical protein